MDDFDYTYVERHAPFQEGAEKGKITAETDKLQDILIQAQQFGIEFAEEMGVYEAYLEVYDKLRIEEELPLLKVNDIVGEMRGIINSLDYTSLPELQERRDTLRNKFQIFKAMVGIKKNARSIQERVMEEGYDF